MKIFIFYSFFVKGISEIKNLSGKENSNADSPQCDENVSFFRKKRSGFDVIVLIVKAGR